MPQCIKWDAPNRQTKIHLIPRPGTGSTEGAEGTLGERVLRILGQNSTSRAQLGCLLLPARHCHTRCARRPQVLHSRHHQTLHEHPHRPSPSPPAARREYVAPHPFVSFHHAHAFETGDGKVVLDTVANLDGVDFSANFEVRGETREAPRSAAQAGCVLGFSIIRMALFGQLPSD